MVVQVENVPEMRTSPSVSPSLAQMIPFLGELDSYLANRQPVSFLSELPGRLVGGVGGGGAGAYNTSLLNALVVYVGSQAIASIQDKDALPSATSIAHTSYMDVFQSLAVNLDTQGRYLFFNAIANQLRYPNSHTHYFSCLLLYLFQESNQEVLPPSQMSVCLTPAMAPPGDPGADNADPL